jgi:nickel-dependent lactate racemase
LNITLTKHVFGDAEVASSRVAGIYEPKKVGFSEMSDEEIRQSITNTIGTKPLRQIAKGCKNVLIVTDDNTRETPLCRIIPMVLEELTAAGVGDKEITFLIGLGTHRAMTEDEITEKFGSEIANKYKIINHTWDDPETLISKGQCELGFEIVINKMINNADFIISMGSIVPHATVGFSGGGKTIMPGICGPRTIEQTHWMALNYSMAEILGNPSNPMRSAIINLCRRINLGMIIDAIVFEGGKLFGLVAGDLKAAHDAGVELCRKVYSVPINDTSEIVIAEAYPVDIDLRQAIKAICSADLVCRDGGVIILAASCPEGISPQFPDFAKYGFKNPDTLYQNINEGKCSSKKLLAYTLIAIGRIICKRVRAILVSPNINLDEAEHLGFISANNLQQAIDKAFEMTGSRAKISVLKQAGIILPVLNSSHNQLNSQW